MSIENIPLLQMSEERYGGDLFKNVEKETKDLI